MKRSFASLLRSFGSCVGLSLTLRSGTWSSRCLISALKDYGGRLIRDGDTLPAPYAAFPIVWHEEQIVAPYSREAVAVRLHEDDITS